jgi:GDP-4-dehydro-6-deoxy-D-mannose reductase
MLRVLITGGTGFVGSHLVPLLQGRGFEVAILAQNRRQTCSVNFYEADIRDSRAVRLAIHDFKPHHVYHLAAISSVEVSFRTPRLTYDLNVTGTCNVFEAAMSLPQPAKILNVSTAQVYARSADPLVETSALGPDNVYAASKAMAEFLAVQFRRTAHGGIVTARAFNHGGPGQSGAFVLSSIAKQFAEIELGLRPPTLLLGNIHVKRDFTDVRDVVEAYLLLLEKGCVNEIYNVCSGRALSIEDLVREFCSITGVRVHVETDPAKRREGENDFVCGNPQRIKAATGWQARIPLTTTLRDLFLYWRSSLRGTAHHSAATAEDRSPLHSPAK